jgi:hypothetical protein
MNGETVIKVGSHCMEEGERNGKTKKGRNGNKEWRDSDKGRLTLHGGRERNGRTKKGRNGNKEWKDNDKGKEEIKFFFVLFLHCYVLS